ncbi:sigma-70 family RNA polymerase sigma factor [uncultured Chitinophaga sp.]|uniref:RNA polymerase sigma factor n=1 Tax=uncultured Chitinophaga sp. TaxID=339340 RepID=UPI0025E989C8|nr:sigma-70 family RNA polymerase sigma factor [uncultured Chitinophaga sp.]
MHLLLNNMTDKELLNRVRKLMDEEAVGTLLERYSHLVVAYSLPKMANRESAAQVIPALLKDLDQNFRTMHIPRANDCVEHTLEDYFSPKKHPNHVSREVQAIYRSESRVQQSGSNPIARQQLGTELESALEKLTAEDQQVVALFYAEQKTFEEIAAARGITKDKVRTILKTARKKLATQLMDQAYE